MYIKKFKNGNFNISRDLLDTEMEQTFIDWVGEIINHPSADFTIACDDFGYSPTATLYNYNTQMFYTVDINDNDKFDKGKTVKIKGFKDDELYQELINQELL